MAKPVEFLVVKNLQSTLSSISVGDGYHHTVAGLAVKLDPDHEVEELIPGANLPVGPPRPWMVLDVSQQESFGYQERPMQVLLSLPFIVHAIHESDVRDDDAKMETYYNLCADVEQALAVDITRGGLANMTSIVGRRMHEREGGGTEVWAQVAGEVRLRREFGKPNG